MLSLINLTMKQTFCPRVYQKQSLNRDQSKKLPIYKQQTTNNSAENIRNYCSYFMIQLLVGNKEACQLMVNIFPKYMFKCVQKRLDCSLEIVEWDNLAWEAFIQQIQQNMCTPTELWNSHFRKDLIFQNISFIQQFTQQLNMNQKSGSQSHQQHQSI